MRALLVPAVLVGALFSGCVSDDGAGIESLVGYPRHGDTVTYEVTGALVDFARWENAQPFPSAGRVRFTVGPMQRVLDGARAVHAAHLVAVEKDGGGGFVKHADLFVSPAHAAVVQGYYPLSQDQGIVSFSERGFPWLFGASSLFGESLTPDAVVAFELPDNLARGRDIVFEWRVVGEERIGGVDAVRLDLAGNASMRGSLWMERGSAWPLRVQLALVDGALAPHVGADGALPALMDARRTSWERGAASVPPRVRAAGFTEDFGVTRVEWTGEMPPDGTAGYIPYLLRDAVNDAKLLDRGLAAWLAAADDPRVYRATYKEDTGPVAGLVANVWFVQFVDRGGRYFEVEVERAPLPVGDQGVPRVTRSGPAEPPSDPNHGWFPREALPDDLVPLSDGARVLRDVFEARGVEVFLRSFVDPPGYSYFLDGGFEDGKRYTMVYSPVTGFIEHATGHAAPRLAREAK